MLSNDFYSKLDKINLKFNKYKDIMPKETIMTENEYLI